MDYESIASTLSLVINETSEKHSNSKIIDCIFNTAQRLNIPPEYVATGLLIFYDNSTQKNIDCHNIINYSIEQVLISNTLFSLMDKYQTAKFSKSKYSKNKKCSVYFRSTFFHLKINPRKYTRFLDLCSGPGAFDLFMLKSNPLIKGSGITLNPSKGGYEVFPELLRQNKRFKVYYKDLLDDKTKKFKLYNPVDFVYSGCFIGHNIGKKHLSRTLYANSYTIAISNLKKGGDMLNLMSFRWDYIFLLDTIYMLEKMFKTISLYKSDKITPGLSHVDIFCEKYNGKPLNENMMNDYMSGKVKLYTEDTLNKYSKTVNSIFKIMNDEHIQLIKISKYKT